MASARGVLGVLLLCMLVFFECTSEVVAARTLDNLKASSGAAGSASSDAGSDASGGESGSGSGSKSKTESDSLDLAGLAAGDSSAFTQDSTIPGQAGGAGGSGSSGSASSGGAEASGSASGEAKGAASVKLMWKDLEAVGPSKRQHHSMVSSPLGLIVFGGCYLDVVCYSDTYVFEGGSSWKRPIVTGAIPGNRGGHTATMVTTRGTPAMWIVGGMADNIYRRDVYFLNTTDFRWHMVRMRGARVRGRAGHSAVMYKSNIVIFGGYTADGYLDDTFIIDTAKKQWLRPIVSGLKGSPTPRSGHAAAISGDVMYVFGGQMSGRELSDMHRLNLLTFKWEAIETMGTGPSHRHGAVMLPIPKQPNYMVVVAGCSYDQETCYNDTYVYDVGARTWDSVNVVAPPPQAQDEPWNINVTASGSSDSGSHTGSSSGGSSGGTSDSGSNDSAGGSSASGGAGKKGGKKKGCAAGGAGGSSSSGDSSSGSGPKIQYRPLGCEATSQGKDSVLFTPRGNIAGAFSGNTSELVIFGGCFLDRNCSFDVLELSLSGVKVIPNPFATGNGAGPVNHNNPNEFVPRTDRPPQDIPVNITIPPPPVKPVGQQVIAPQQHSSGGNASSAASKTAAKPAGTTPAPSTDSSTSSSTSSGSGPSSGSGSGFLKSLFGVFSFREQLSHAKNSQAQARAMRRDGRTPEMVEVADSESFVRDPQDFEIEDEDPNDNDSAKPVGAEYRFAASAPSTATKMSDAVKAAKEQRVKERMENKDDIEGHKLARAALKQKQQKEKEKKEKREAEEAAKQEAKKEKPKVIDGVEVDADADDVKVHPKLRNVNVHVKGHDAEGKDARKTQDELNKGIEGERKKVAPFVTKQVTAKAQKDIARIQHKMKDHGTVGIVKSTSTHEDAKKAAEASSSPASKTSTAATSSTKAASANDASSPSIHYKAVATAMSKASDDMVSRFFIPLGGLLILIFGCGGYVLCAERKPASPALS